MLAGQPLTWLGGSGAWDASAQNWSNGAQQTAWVPGDVAVFNTNCTVTVSGTVVVSGITFLTGSSCHIAAGAGAEISLYQTTSLSPIEVDSSGGTVDKYTVVNDTIDPPIVGTGSAGLDKVGSGDVALTSASNAFPGGVTLNGGALTFAPGALGSTTIDAAPGSDSNYFAALVFDGSGTLANPIQIDSGTLRLDTHGSIVSLAGNITGSGALWTSDTQGNGTLLLTGDNSNFSGPTTIVSGTLDLDPNPSLGNVESSLGSGTLTVDGGVLSMEGDSYTSPASFTIKSGDIANGTLDLASTLAATIGAGRRGPVGNGAAMGHGLARGEFLWNSA